MEEVAIAVVSAIVGSIASKAVDLLAEAAAKRKASKQPGKHAKRP